MQGKGARDKEREGGRRDTDQCVGYPTSYGATDFVWLPARYNKHRNGRVSLANLKTCQSASHTSFQTILIIYYMRLM